MRFGLLLETGGDLALEPLAEQAACAEDHGFDLVWLDERHGAADGIPTPLVAVAALAPRVASVRLGASVDVGAVHPITVAEEAAVADQVSGGRLVLGLRAAAGVPAARFAEAVDVVLAAQAPRPFRHEGETWRIPANLPDNTSVEQRVRVTPPPAQLEPTVWLQGGGAEAAARERALAYLGGAGDSDEELAAVWRAAAAHLGPAAARLRRPALRDAVVTAAGDVDADGLVTSLRAAREAWGLDVVVWCLPAGLDRAARLRAVAQLATRVWPRVQIDRLPAGLEERWREEEDAQP
ncbi:MAG TPA: LLM class flavin-dependent oxidoreductase [Egibacteraceae bacterium]